jgi:peptide/nickel transport system ATP-binding protein
VRNVVKRYPGGGRIARTVVDDVSFALRHGETLGIVGESGSGKTTVARIALGVEKPDTGQALVGGRQWDAVPRGERSAARREVQLIAQDPLASFDPRYTVAKVLGEPLNVAGFRGADARQRARELLDLVRLPDTALASRPLELSGGQRQRVAIARALAVEPTVIVADEPVSALDVSVQAQILDLFADVQREFGVSYLFISHDLGVMHHVADRVLVLSGGRVVEEGEIEAVFTSPQHSCTRELLAAIPRLDAARGGQQEIGRP